MQRSTPFRLNRSGILAALVSAAFAGEAAAVAGRVDFTTGGVTVAGRDGQQRPLARGASLDSGDTVRTDANGRAQIRFTDGSYVSLQPNTDFAISEYRFDGKADGSERGFYGLVRGAMRTVTGAIGRVNRNAYRVTTPTATVGIRGTGGVIQVLNDGSTLVIGTSGIWSLTNPAGSIDVPAGVTGLAPTEPNTPPRESNTQPQTAPAPVEPEKPIYTQGENVNQQGAPDLVVPLVSGSGYYITPFWANGTSNALSASSGNIDAIFDAGGRLTEFKNSAGAMWKSDNGAHAEFGTDGILAWGRWTGNVIANGTPQSYGPNTGLHYVIGMPTPTMPTTGTATYSLLGATNPTYLSASTGPGTLTSASLNVTFGPAFHTVGTAFTIAMPDGQGFSVNGSTTCASGSSFSIFGASVTGSGGACSSSCGATINGFFAGSSAERAGRGYHNQEFGGTAKQVLGAAAFKRN